MKSYLLKSVLKYGGILLASFGTGLIIGNQDNLVEKVKKSLFSKYFKSSDKKDFQIPEFIKSDKDLLLQALIKFCENLVPKVEVIRNVAREKNEDDGSKAKCFFDPETYYAYKIEIYQTNEYEEIRLLVHEIAHAILHNGVKQHNEKGNSSSKELEAEITTYLVLNEIGFKLSELDLEYLNGYFDKIGEAVLAFEKSREKIYFAYEKILSWISEFAKNINESNKNSKKKSKRKKSFVAFEQKFIFRVNTSRIIQLKKIIHLFKNEKYVELRSSIKKFQEKRYENPLIKEFISKILILSNDLYSGPGPNDIFIWQNYSLVDAFIAININAPSEAMKSYDEEYKKESKRRAKKEFLDEEKEFHELDEYEFFIEYLQGSTWWQLKSIGIQWNMNIDTSNAKKLSKESKIATRITDIHRNVYKVFDSSGVEVDIVEYKLGNSNIPI